MDFIGIVIDEKYIDVLTQIIQFGVFALVLWVCIRILTRKKGNKNGR